MSKEITKQELATALFDILDGCGGWHEIQYNTGLNQERCEEIYALYIELGRIGSKDNYEFNEFRNK